MGLQTDVLALLQCTHELQGTHSCQSGLPCEKYTALIPSRKASKKSRVTRPPHAAAHASKAVRTHCTAPLLHMLKAIRPVAGASGAPALPRPGSSKERAAHARTSKTPSELPENKQMFSGQTQCEVGWCQPHTTLAAQRWSCTPVAAGVSPKVTE
jgi:hypothetical protein